MDNVSYKRIRVNKKMTNFEKYRDTILELTKTGCLIAIIQDKPQKCKNINCSDCLLKDDLCQVGLAKWLYKEYKPKPTLSQRAYHFLKSLPEGSQLLINGGIIHMDVDGEIYDTSYTYNQFIPGLNLKSDQWYRVADILEWEIEDE